MALVYGVTVGPTVDHDVVARRLSITIDGVQVDVADWPADSTSLGEVTVPQGSNVVLTLVDVDDAGNASEPAVVEFTAVDTIPPAKPGEFGVSVLREIAD